MTSRLKNELIAYKNGGRRDTFIYRNMVQSIIRNKDVYYENNADSMKTNHPVVLACAGKTFVYF